MKKANIFPQKKQNITGKIEVERIEKVNKQKIFNLRPENSTKVSDALLLKKTILMQREFQNRIMKYLGGTIDILVKLGQYIFEQT